jgi:hypothetical protein
MHMQAFDDHETKESLMHWGKETLNDMLSSTQK